ncbi:hypothetical protein RAD15_43270 [Bradyrhizobium sp. 14AA]
MDRNLILRSLAIAERHVLQGKSHLAKQQALVAKLDRDGRDTTDALALLSNMRETQRLRISERDRLLAQLGVSLK